MKEMDEETNFAHKGHEVTSANSPTCKQFIKTKLNSDSYARQIIFNRPHYNLLALALSDFTVQLYDVERMSPTTEIKAHSNTIHDLKFGADEDNILWTCSTDGTIKKWDVRLEVTKPVQQFHDDSSGELKPLLNFDINHDSTLVCAGTEQVREDAFLLFWDCRASKLMGGYWESHTDDITQVFFHPDNRKLLASGSTDGLINIFDVCENSEEDALMNTLNTVSSVNKLSWHANDSDLISCLTDTNDFQLWDSSECTMIYSYNKEQFKENYNVDYLVDLVHRQDDDELYIVGGGGTCIGDGKVIACSKSDTRLHGLLCSGHTDLIRSATDTKAGFATSGEDRSLHMWRWAIKSDDIGTPQGKVKSSKKYGVHERKPY